MFKFAQTETNFAQTVTHRLGLDNEGGRGRGRRRQCAQREAGSRSTATARSEGGRVEVDSNNVTMTKSLRKRTAGHALRPGSRWWCAPGPETRRRRAPGPGSRTTGGGDVTVVSRVITERERA
jgi:hypothetical protein